MADSKTSWRDIAPFTLSAVRDCTVPLLIAAPHGGRTYGEVLAANMRHFDSVAVKLEDRYIDLVAQEVADEAGAASLVAHVPRAVVDLNRFSDDVDWSMVTGPTPGNISSHGRDRRARSGLGLIPRRLPETGEIWSQRLAKSEVEERVEQVHRPYHAALRAALEGLRDRWGAVLLVDMHSMPPLRREGGGRGASFVIGDRFGSSCAPVLAAEALSFLGRQGHATAHNRPYAGGYVLDRHGEPARNIHAIQLEICRSLYLDEAMVHLATTDKLRDLLTGLCRNLAERVADLASNSRGFDQAAE